MIDSEGGLISVKRYVRSLFLALLLAASMCGWAHAEEADPVPDVDAMEDQCQIFQTGTLSGPQTIPGTEAHAGTWESELEARALAEWEKGWAAIRNEPLSQETVYYFDVSDLGIKYPGKEASEEARQAYEAFRTVMSRLVNDHPGKMFYADGWWLKSKSDEDPWYGAYSQGCWELKYIALRYLEFGGLTGVEAEGLFNAALEEAMAQVAGVSDPLERILILHDYLVSHTSYNYERAHNQPAPSNRIYGAYGALVDGDAVCHGYTLAYKALLNKAGIESLFVGSDRVDGIGHAWNLVELDGEYYHIDATWNDKAEGNSRYTYFLLSDETFKEIHKPYNSWSAPLPEANSKKYEAGWFFNGAKSIIYRRQGRYYAVKSHKEVFTSDSLASQGTDVNTLGRELHIDPSCGCVWDDGYLYYVYWDTARQKTLMAFHLDSGHMIQADRFDSGGASRIGLRLQDGAIVLTDPDTKGWPQLASILLLPSQAEAVPVVKGWSNQFPLYYHNGLFYAVNTLMNGAYIGKFTVTASPTLGGQGENPDTLDRNLQIDVYHGVIWLGGYLYYMGWTSSGPEVLMAFQLDTGRIIQLGQFEDPREAWFGLRYDGEADRIAAYRGEEELISVPALPANAGSGITAFDGGSTALAQVSQGQTLWTARYQDGRMLDVRQEDLVPPDGHWAFGTPQLDALAIPLSQGSQRVRVFLVDDRWMPVCPAA